MRQRCLDLSSFSFQKHLTDEHKFFPCKKLKGRCTHYSWFEQRGTFPFYPSSSIFLCLPLPCEFFCECSDRVLISFLSPLLDGMLYWSVSAFGFCGLTACLLASQEHYHELSFLDLLLLITLVKTWKFIHSIFFSVLLLMRSFSFSYY